ncbi:hypothetical protein F5887DRAFT_576636 [Amanita rubescens]|nr:hypothetical protein F5887DRAFT_576636 [Amanita rubescens]
MLQLKLTGSLITTGRSRVRLKSTKGPSIAVCSSLLLPLSLLNAICRTCKPFSVTRIHLRAARVLHLQMKYPVLLDITHLENWGKRIKNCSITASIRFRSGNKGSVGVTRTRISMSTMPEWRGSSSHRVQWMTSIGEELGGPQKGLDMLKGRGIAHILKSIEIQFRRPVTYPDTVLVGYRPNIPSELEDRMVLLVTAKAYSVQQQAFVAIANEVLVWYDYDKLKKCDPGDRIWDIVRNRVRVSCDRR